MGDRILSPRPGGLCWMPQLLPALCLPEPSASSHSLRPPAAHCSFHFHLFHSSIPASCRRKPQPGSEVLTTVPAPSTPSAQTF